MATTVASGRILTNNPVWTTIHDGDVVVHAVPDDDTSALVAYRLQADEAAA